MSETALKPRYEWVDYAKGICIFAVVSLYSASAARDAFGDAGWIQHWADFAKPFRMPDFFLISGLFLARVIARPLRGYIDKKVLHYLYFFLLWSAINLVLLYATGAKHGTIRTFLVDYWAMTTSWPFNMLWFIQMLALYFLFTRMIRSVPVWIVLPIAAALQVFPPPHVGRTMTDEFFCRYVYFYAGYAFSPLFFRLAAAAQRRPWWASLGLILWGGTNGVLVAIGYAAKPLIGLALAFAGASAIITLGALAEKLRFARWIRYLGQNSIVVYLAFFWPMTAASLALKDIPLMKTSHGLFGVIVTAAGILGSLSIFWIINWRTTDRWLFRRPEWATLGDHQPTPPSGAMPQPLGQS